MTRISFRRHRDSWARYRLGSCWSAAKIFHLFEKYLVSKYPLIPTSQLIQFLVSVVWARLGTRRNGACLPTQSPWQLPRSRAPDTGNIFSKHRQNIFEFCDGFCRKTWAELTTEVSRKSGFSPCNTIHLYRITDIQLPPPQTHNLRLLLFTKCSECIKLKSFLQEGYLCGAIISLWQGSGWLKLNWVLNTTWF